MTSAYFFGWDYTINKPEKTAWQLVNRKADFLLNESIRIDSRNESNRIDSNRELECSSRQDGNMKRYCSSCSVNAFSMAAYSGLDRLMSL